MGKDVAVCACDFNNEFICGKIFKIYFETQKLLLNFLFKKCEIVLENVLSTSNNDFVKNHKALIWKNGNGNSLINASWFFIEEITKATMHWQISSQDKGNEIQILKSSADVCKISKGVVANFMVKLLIEKWKTDSNLRLECPIKKGFYTISNHKLDEKYFPSHFLIRDFNFTIQTLLMGKTKEMKSLVEIMKLKMFATFKHSNQ